MWFGEIGVVYVYEYCVVCWGVVGVEYCIVIEDIVVGLVVEVVVV